MFTTFTASPESITVSRFADIVSVEQFIENSTECCLGISDAEERVKTYGRNSPKRAECIHQRIYHYGTKDNREDYEPSSLRSLMASFERYLKKKNSTFLSKALINRQP